MQGGRARIKDDRLTAMSKDPSTDLRNLQLAEKEPIMSACKACASGGPVHIPWPDRCAECLTKAVATLLERSSTDHSILSTIQDRMEKQLPIETHTVDAQAESYPPGDGEGSIEAKSGKEGLDVSLASEVARHPSHVPGTVDTNEAGETCDEGGETPKRKSRKKKGPKSKQKKRSTKGDATQVHDSGLGAQEETEVTEDQAPSDKGPQTPKSRTPRRRNKDQVCATCHCLTPNRKGKPSGAAGNFCDKCNEERTQRRESLRSHSEWDDRALNKTDSVENPVKVKLRFILKHKEVWHRWGIHSSDSLSSLLNSISKELNCQEAVDLEYLDDDGDAVTLRNDEDVTEMFSIVNKSRIDPLRLNTTLKQD